MATHEQVEELRRALVATQDRVITLETTARDQLARLEQQAAIMAQQATTTSETMSSRRE